MIDWEAFKSQLQSNPGKILGFVLSLAVCFLLIWVLVVVRSDADSTQTISVNQKGRLDELRLSLQDSTELIAHDKDTAGSVSTLPVRQSESQKPDGGSSSLSGVLPTLVIMIGAIAGLWFWIRKRNQGESGSKAGELFTKIGTQEIMAGQQLSVIMINGEYWVLGIGSQGLTLLHRYAEEEWDGPSATTASAAGDWKKTLFASMNMGNEKITQKQVNGDERL